MISFLIPVVTTPYISRILGENNVGLFSYIQSIASYFILLGCLGLNSYGQREIAYHSEDMQKKSLIFWELTIIRVVAIMISLCLYILSVIFLLDNKVYYLLFSVEIVANMLDINWFYMGNEDFRLQFLRNIIVKLAFVISIFLFVKNRDGLIIYTVCYILSTLIGNIILWLDIRSRIVSIDRRQLDIRRHFRAIFIMFLPQLAINLYTQLNKTLLGILTGYEYEAVAYFTQADKIIKLVLTVVTSLGAVMLTKISSTIVNEGYEKGKEYLYKSYHFMSLLAWPMACGLFAVSDSFVVWFFGENYMPVSNCLKILSISILFITTSNALGMQYLIPTNRMKEYNGSIFFGLIVNIIFNCLLIPRYKEVGTSVSSLLSELAVMTFQLIFLRQTIDHKRMFFTLDMLKIVISSAIMGFVAMGVSRLVTGSFFSLFISITVGTVVYGVCLWMLKETHIRELIKKFIGRNK